MNIRDIYPTVDSGLPPLGDARSDAAYVTFLGELVVDARADHPGIKVNIWRLNNHLYKWLHAGIAEPKGRAKDNRFKIRYVGAIHAFDPERVEAEALRYIEEVAAQDGATVS